MVINEMQNWIDKNKANQELVEYWQGLSKDQKRIVLRCFELLQKSDVPPEFG